MRWHTYLFTCLGGAPCFGQQGESRKVELYLSRVTICSIYIEAAQVGVVGKRAEPSVLNHDYTIVFFVFFSGDKSLKIGNEK